MDRDGAENAKAEVFQQVFGFTEVAAAASADRTVPLFMPAQGTSSYRQIVLGRRRKRRDARDLIAVGVLPSTGHNRDPDGLQLGIFIQRSDLHGHPIVEASQRLARGEARVIYTGRVVRRAATNPGRCRPLRIGASVGHFGVTAGTIGCFCRHRDGGIGILSNNHVLANLNRAARGDVIIQPGRLDGGMRHDPESRIATLYKSIDLTFEPGTRNLVDCAFATLVGEVDHEAGIVSDPLDARTTWQVGATVDDLLIEDKVQKVGRTTGLTRGRVTAVDVDNLVVAMVLGHGEKLARFDRQIAMEGADGPFSRGGDSGSVIFTEGGAPSALLFAGTERGGLGRHGVTFANPIRAVLEALELDLHTQS